VRSREGLRAERSGLTRTQESAEGIVPSAQARPGRHSKAEEAEQPIGGAATRDGKAGTEERSGRTSGSSGTV
jgi:hypothetical protein